MAVTPGTVDKVADTVGMAAGIQGMGRVERTAGTKGMMAGWGTLVVEKMEETMVVVAVGMVATLVAGMVGTVLAVQGMDLGTVVLTAWGAGLGAAVGSLGVVIFNTRDR